MRNYLRDSQFLEKGNAENLQDFAKTTLDFELLLVQPFWARASKRAGLDDGHQYVDTDPDLGLDRVFGSSI